MAMHMPVSVASFEPDLLNDIRVEHGQPLCNEGQAAHACKDLQRWLDGAGLQQGLVSGGVHTFFTGCHWFVLRTAVHYVTVIHCKESKKRTCCMFMHCLTSGTLVNTVFVWNFKFTVRRIPSLKWERFIALMPLFHRCNMALKTSYGQNQTWAERCNTHLTVISANPPAFIALARPCRLMKRFK